LETDDNRDNEEIAMVTKLVSNDNNNSFKLPLYYVFLEDTKYGTILKYRKEEDLY
jgi:hypothetical protein